jgi:hypothetical protein
MCSKCHISFQSLLNIYLGFHLHRNMLSGLVTDSSRSEIGVRVEIR